jgi:serine phosphatase RsbU (regulator of sigma subunit)
VPEGAGAGENPHAAADALAVGWAIADTVDWRVEYANAAFDTWFPSRHGDDLLAERLDGLQTERARKRISRGRTFVFETEIRSGARPTVLRTSLREVDHDGRRVLIVETLDVSKHKEVEHMLDSFSKLADRNKIQLERANRALEQKTEELGQAYDLIKAQKDRMERELQVAREVQQNMMPIDFAVTHEECTVAAVLKPALEVGGDFFDFFYVDTDRLCFLVGDVSDKGAASGLFMAAAKTLIKVHAMRAESTAGVVSRVNRELAVNNDSCMFVTLFLGLLDLRTGEVVFTNAGHDPPYVIREGVEPELVLARNGLPLGVMDEAEYSESEITLEPDDLLLVYSDGVTEAMNSEGEVLGSPRVEELLTTDQALTPESVVRALAERVETFEDGTPQSDDVTAIALKFHGH